MNVEIEDETDTERGLKPRYIQLVHSYFDRDFAGRHTTLEAGSYGALLEEAEIESLYDVSPKKKEECLERLRSAREANYFLALIAGYVCTLPENAFIRKNPIISMVPWTIF